MLIREATRNDFQRIADINASEEEKTSRIDAARVIELDSLVDYHKVVVAGDQVIGFLMAMSDASDYDGDNFRWFADRYPRFLYIDRIVIHPSHAGIGAGGALYRDLIQFAKQRDMIQLCCEINVVPPNPASHKFHARFGFSEVGRSPESESAKVVSYQVAEL